MKATISILCILATAFSLSFSMEPCSDIGALCMKERIGSDKKESRTFYVCLQKKNLCEQQESCCYQDKSCCIKKKTCCSKVTGCCGDQECGCTTDANKMVEIRLKFKTPMPMRIQYTHYNQELLFEWFVKKAETDKRFITAYNTSGETILHSLARRGNAQLCKQLLRLGADPNIKQLLFPQETPLHVAKTKKVIKVLSKAKGINFEEENVYGNTPLFTHVKNNNYENVKFLLEQGVNLDHTNCMSFTILHHAGWCDAPSALVNLLLEKGASHTNRLCGFYPVETMNPENILEFEKYGYVIFETQIDMLLKDNARRLYHCSTKAKVDEREEEALEKLKLVFKKFLEICAIKDEDLLPEQKSEQRIYYSEYKHFQVISRYPSYELLCSYFGKHNVDFVIDLLS